MAHKNINEFVIGDNICDYYILKSFYLKLTRTNKQYLDVTLADKTGTISGKLWDVTEDMLANLTNGCFVSTVFSVSSYNDMLQADLKGIAKVPSTDLTKAEIEALVPCIDENPDELFDELVSTLNSFKNEQFKNLGLDTINHLKSDLVSYPGAKSVHHSEIGGLLLHTVEVVRFVKAIHAVTPWFDEEVSILGAMLHDIGKIQEFTLGDTGLVADYSAKGQLLGHIYMGTEYMGNLCIAYGISEEKTMLLQHIILAHHGKPEFGSAISPHTMEAEVVHMADDLSAKLHVYKDAIKDIEPGEFSDRIFALDGVKVYRPKD